MLGATRYTIFPQSINARLRAEIIVMLRPLRRAQIKDRKLILIKKSLERRRYLGRLWDRRLLAHILGNEP
jgi:hypothetical protein